MSKGPQIEINTAASRVYIDVGSEFKIPKLTPEERRQLSKEEWMARYGEVHKSEAHFERKTPRWNYNEDSWWYHSVGRDNGKEPLWMRREWHLPELDCPPGRDRHSETVDERRKKGEVPLWAQRMNLGGSFQGDQSATIYGHRKEYKPTEKTDARSMYERYQPSYDRILNDELCDISDPADGRFWKAGLAQGVSTNPYEKRLVIACRRKPIVVGPHTAAVVVDGEMHTLGNAYAELGWWHPHMEMVAYSIEHPVYRHVNLRAQMKEASGVSGEQGMCEVLEMSQDVFGHMGDVMEQEAEAFLARQSEREAEMDRIALRMAEMTSPDPALEERLFGKRA